MATNRQPLAVRLRPTVLVDVLGQGHLTGPATPTSPGGPLRLMVESGHLRSCILWGPAGTGKTTLARLVASESNSGFFGLDATSAGVKELRKLIADACDLWDSQQRLTVVFIDEIHRWTKAQQDVLLPAVEEGVIILLGATTERPKFAVNSTILSRLLVFEVKPLGDDDMLRLARRVLRHYGGQGRKVIFSSTEVVRLLINRCSGDARKLVTVMELIVESLLESAHKITAEHVQAAIPDKHLTFDAAGTEHYDLAHCYQEAIQHSDPDGAIYWLAKWLASGEDPAYICRRLLITAYEDCAGTPEAIAAAVGACYVTERVGLPECQIAMATATVLMAQAPRDKTGYRAIKAAMDDVANGVTVHVPPELRAGNAHGGDYVPVIATGAYVQGTLCNPKSTNVGKL